MAEQIDEERAVQGRLLKVANQNPVKIKSGHQVAAKEYHAVWVEDNKGKEFPLLFTNNEIERAVKRAKKNPEDIPKKGIFSNILDNLL